MGFDRFFVVISYPWRESPVGEVLFSKIKLASLWAGIWDWRWRARIKFFIKAQRKGGSTTESITLPMLEFVSNVLNFNRRLVKLTKDAVSEFVVSYLSLAQLALENKLLLKSFTLPDFRRVSASAWACGVVLVLENWGLQRHWCPHLGDRWQ